MQVNIGTDIQDDDAENTADSMDIPQNNVDENQDPITDQPEELEDQTNEELQTIVFKKWKVNVTHQVPNTALKIKTQIHGREVNALLDTGASICLMSEEIVHQLNLKIDKFERTNIYGIGGKDHQTKTLGKVVVPITIGQLKFPQVNFHVVKDTCIDEDMFIGHEFLRTYGLKVNVFRKCLKYRDKKT